MCQACTHLCLHIQTEEYFLEWHIFFPTCNDSFRTSSNRCAISEEGMANYWNHNLEVHIMLSTDIIRLLHHHIIRAS